MALTWSKELETGNAQIDNEHRQLIAAAAALLEACSQGKGRQELDSAVAFLSDYTKTHFAHEEALQQKYKYPEYAEHRAWHQSFLKDFAQVAAKLKTDGATISMVAEVNGKLGQVLTHIRTMDLALARFIHKSL